MKILDSRTAYYPLFSIGCEPAAVRCTLAIVESNGRKYFQTPFAFLDSIDGEDIGRNLQPGNRAGFFATAEECDAYLAAEYPLWRKAEPIMDALCSALAQSTICGPARLADRLGVSDLNGQLHRLARGHKSVTARQLKAALAVLNARHEDPQSLQSAY